VFGNLRINRTRLVDRIHQLGKIGALPGGGVSRLALTPADLAGREQVIAWMRAANLEVTIDGIGNVVATRKGRLAGRPVMTGSHIDTVRSGGLYDGNLGVLAGLEVIATLDDAGLTTDRPLAVAFFSNEEGARFAPDMMGSLVYEGSLPLEQALATVGIDKTTVGENLDAIGQRGPAPCGEPHVHAFIELHVEQGPVLERKGVTIGVVEGVQGICWRSFCLEGVSNHAGTTPMSMRQDAGLVMGQTIAFVRELTAKHPGIQLATVGSVTLEPNLINVIPRRARFTVDLRNTEGPALWAAEQAVIDFIRKAAEAEGLQLTHESLARLEPVRFSPAIVNQLELVAGILGHSHVRMPSGAGHDAQVLARCCPAGMIFVPSVGGISHNPREFTTQTDIEAGANVLLHSLLRLATVN